MMMSLLTARAREEVAHLSSNRAMTTDMRPRIEERGKETFELYPEVVKGREGQNLCDGRRGKIRSERVVETSG
jgi:hypothetical protein